MQLSKFETISKENIIFHEPKDYQLRNTNIKYQRTKLPNGKISPLVLETPFKPREAILEIKESDDEDDYESENEDKPFDEDED